MSDVGELQEAPDALAEDVAAVTALLYNRYVEACERLGLTPRRRSR